MSALDAETQSNNLFDSAIWIEPLDKFARALGVTIAFYDPGAERRGLISPGPIGEYLRDQGFWAPAGRGTSVDQAAAQACLATRETLFTNEFDLFAHLSVPLILADEVVAVFVLGWIPEHFVDPVACDAFAKIMGVPAMDVWQIMRMQQPVTRTKLDTYGRLLETFSAPLLHQLSLKAEGQRRMARSLLLNQAIADFTTARSERALSETLFTALRALLPAAKFELLVAAPEGGRATRYVDHPRGVPGPDPRAEVRGEHLTVKVPAASAASSGAIEIVSPGARLSEDQVALVHALAAHLGSALQKVALIDDLRAANDQLMHLHKMKDEFLATISHELRTPLTAILGWSQLLTELEPDDANFKPALSTIYRNAQNQSRLIEDLLDVSRIISGKMNLVREPLEATLLLKQCLQTLQPMTEARHQTVRLSLPAADVSFRGDGTRINQIFWNLLSNASKFTPEGGDIFVRLERAGHYFKLEVEDTGRGIAPEFLPNLFDRFSQADGSYSRQHGGLGLGLAIVRHLVELHGGTVSATSAGLGAGATFTVLLPQNTTDRELDSAHRLSASRELNAGERSFDLARIRILLVDDEPEALRLIKFALEKEGADVELANCAREGLALVTAWHPDVIVSDISMPGESGLDLIRQVRALSRADGGDVPAIALTALTGGDAGDRILGAGFQLHLPKPLEPARLYEGVKGLIGRRAYAVPVH